MSALGINIRHRLWEHIASLTETIVRTNLLSNAKVLKLHFRVALKHFSLQINSAQIYSQNMMKKIKLFDIIWKWMQTWESRFTPLHPLQNVTMIVVCDKKPSTHHWCHFFSESAWFFFFYPPPRIMFESCSRASLWRKRHSACHSPSNHMLTSQFNVKQYKLWLGLSVLLFVQTLSISHSSLILKEKSLPCWLNKLQTSLQPTEVLFLFYCFFFSPWALVSPSRCLSAQGPCWMNSRAYLGGILGFDNQLQVILLIRTWQRFTLTL